VSRSDAAYELGVVDPAITQDTRISNRRLIGAKGMQQKRTGIPTIDVVILSMQSLMPVW
jgi:hypothetical protein